MPRLPAVLIVASMFASACGTLPNRAGVGRLAPAAFTEAEVGVVVFSTGAPGRCIHLSTFMEVFELASGNRVGAPLVPVDPYVNRSDFPDHHGAVNALRLPAGSYYLSPRVANPSYHSDEKPTFVFNVYAGETSYAGQLFMPHSCSLVTAFEIRDEYDRDIALALQRNPAIGTRPVVRRLMRGRAPGEDQD